MNAGSYWAVIFECRGKPIARMWRIRDERGSLKVGWVDEQPVISANTKNKSRAKIIGQKLEIDGKG